MESLALADAARRLSVSDDKLVALLRCLRWSKALRVGFIRASELGRLRTAARYFEQLTAQADAQLAAHDRVARTVGGASDVAAIDGVCGTTDEIDLLGRSVLVALVRDDLTAGCLPRCAGDRAVVPVVMGHMRAQVA